MRDIDEKTRVMPPPKKRNEQLDRLILQRDLLLNEAGEIQQEICKLLKRGDALKLVDTKCQDCGHTQEDFVRPTAKEQDLDDCRKCGHANMEVVTGQIQPNSAAKHPESGSGPWG